MFFYISIIVCITTTLVNCKNPDENIDPNKQPSKRQIVEAFTGNSKFHSVFYNNNPEETLSDKFLGKPKDTYRLSPNGQYIFHVIPEESIGYNDNTDGENVSNDYTYDENDVEEYPTGFEVDVYPIDDEDAAKHIKCKYVYTGTDSGSNGHDLEETKNAGDITKVTQYITNKETDHKEVASVAENEIVPDNPNHSDVDQNLEDNLQQQLETIISSAPSNEFPLNSTNINNQISLPEDSDKIVTNNGESGQKIEEENIKFNSTTPDSYVALINDLLLEGGIDIDETDNNTIHIENNYNNSNNEDDDDDDGNVTPPDSNLAIDSNTTKDGNKNPDSKLDTNTNFIFPTDSDDNLTPQSNNNGVHSIHNSINMVDDKQSLKGINNNNISYTVGELDVIKSTIAALLKNYVKPPKETFNNNKVVKVESENNKNKVHHVAIPINSLDDNETVEDTNNIKTSYTFGELEVIRSTITALLKNQIRPQNHDLTAVPGEEHDSSQTGMEDNAQLQELEKYETNEHVDSNISGKNVTIIKNYNMAELEDIQKTISAILKNKTKPSQETTIKILDPINSAKPSAQSIGNTEVNRNLLNILNQYYPTQTPPKYGGKDKDKFQYNKKPQTNGNVNKKYFNDKNDIPVSNYWSTRGDNNIEDMKTLQVGNIIWRLFDRIRKGLGNIVINTLRP